MRADYGWAPDQAWLDKVRVAAVRLTGGCSASFVSDAGPDPHQSPLRRRLRRGAFDGREQHPQERLHGPRPRRGEKCAGQQAEVVTVDQGRDAAGEGGDRQRTGEAAVKARTAVIAQHESKAAPTPPRPLPGRLALRRRPVQALHLSQIFRTSGWSGRPRPRRRSSAATPTISTSRATRSMPASCAPMRTASRSRRRSIWNGARARRSTARRRSSSAIPARPSGCSLPNSSPSSARSFCRSRVDDLFRAARPADRRDGSEPGQGARRPPGPGQHRKQPQGLYRPGRRRSTIRPSPASSPPPRPQLKAKSAGNAAIGNPWGDVAKAMSAYRSFYVADRFSLPSGRPVRLCHDAGAGRDRTDQAQ